MSRKKAKKTYQRKHVWLNIEITHLYKKTTGLMNYLICVEIKLKLDVLRN